MPELPEVETVRRIIERAAVGKRIVAASCARPKLIEAVEAGAPAEAGRGIDCLVGARLEGVERRAKWLTLRFDRDPQAILHLRMTGQVAAIAPDGGREVAGPPVPAYDAPLPAK